MIRRAHDFIFLSIKIRMELILQKPFERIINLFKKHRVNAANLSILLSAITKQNQRMALYKIPKIIIAPCFLSLDKQEIFHNSSTLIQSIRIKIKQFREQARDTLKERHRFRYIEALRKEIELNTVLASLAI